MIVKNSIDTILKDNTFLSVLRSSFRNFLPSKIRLLFIIICSSLIFFYPSYTKITGDSFTNVVEYSNTVILALLALLVTGYSIFQALSSTDSLITFFLQKINEKKFLYS